MATCKSCGDECKRHAQHHEHCQVCGQACDAAEHAYREFLDALKWGTGRSGGSLVIAVRG